MPWLLLQDYLDSVYMAIQTNYVPMMHGLLRSLLPGGYQPIDELWRIGCVWLNRSKPEGLIFTANLPL